MSWLGNAADPSRMDAHPVGGLGSWALPLYHCRDDIQAPPGVHKDLRDIPEAECVGVPEVVAG